MCKDETSASGSPKLDIAGSQGSILRGKKLRKYILAFTTQTVIPIFLQRRVVAWQSFCIYFVPQS